MLGIFNGAATKAGAFIIHLVHLRNHYSGKRSICTATRNRIINMFQLDDDDDNDKLKVRFSTVRNHLLLRFLFRFITFCSSYFMLVCRSQSCGPFFLVTKYAKCCCFFCTRETRKDVHCYPYSH